jgi:glycerol-3-phosphate acyltransferase PlsY
MKNRIVTLIKIFMISVSLLNYGYLSPMLRADSPEIEASLGPLLWLRLPIFLAYVTVPIIALLVNNYISYTLLTAFFLLRIIIEIAASSPFIFSFHLIIVSSYIFAAFLSLFLAAESFSSKIRGEILKLHWSQF